MQRPPCRAPCIPFGPDANCTLEICGPDFSVYGYIPGLSSNAIFLAIFAVAMLAHVIIGLIWKQWWFMCCMVAGCVDEILGYAGRVWMNQDLWNFKAFMIQVVCVTTAPVFFCAAIYVLLAKTNVGDRILAFGPSFSRFNPALFYWIFIPCDVVSLVLQAAGGALSSTSSGKNQAGINLALAGLALQVIFLVIFCGLYADYLWRYFQSEEFLARAHTQKSFARRLKLFYASEALAVAMILMRCAFRVHELKDGYTQSNQMLRHEELFIGLEGVPIVLAAFFLAVGHPGLIFGDGTRRRSPLASPKQFDAEGNKEKAAETPAEAPAKEPAEEAVEEVAEGAHEESVST
ncbi:hypothetical protein N8I77_008200 [Diaporthe amygdali]|uniref:Sphingoid long-chain base transporter RSB1 n=1 Tax=Phomopsis amygdali TaxID=1214568 RepID=A0AAD9W2B5_PHOAM|nr:hypothetical protein N8I77_008200 [Diaporthe amygdali]